MKIRVKKKWLRVAFHAKLAWNFMWDALDTNSHIYHPERPDGQRFETVHGPCFRYNRLDVHAPSTGHRVWFYFPSGRCWHLDMAVDRRKV